MERNGVNSIMQDRTGNGRDAESAWSGRADNQSGIRPPSFVVAIRIGTSLQGQESAWGCSRGGPGGRMVAGDYGTACPPKLNQE